MFTRRFASAVRRLPLAAILFFGLAAANDSSQPELSPPFNIGGEPEIAAAAGWRYHPAVASGAGGYLAVWQDKREGSWAIYGTRVGPNGDVLDPAGLRIAPNPTSQLEPAIAFDGTNYLVVWQEHNEDAVDIHGTRVDPAGRILDQGSIPICTAEDWQTVPDVAFDGQNFLVAWADARGDRDIYAARIDTSGLVLDPEGFPVSTAVDAQGGPAIAFDGSNYMVVWSDYRNRPLEGEVYGARITRSGHVLDPDGIVVSSAPNQQALPDISFDGTNYMVVWQDRREGVPPWDIYATRMDTSGAVLDPEGILLSGDVEQIWRARIGFDGENYFATWAENDNIHALRVSPSGMPIGEGVIVVSAEDYDQSGPAPAAGNGVFLVVWTDERDLRRQIYGARVDASGSVLEPDGTLLSTSAERQWAPAVAAGGDNYLVVWQNLRDSAPGSRGAIATEIHGTIVEASGALPAQTSTIIAPKENSPELPAVASDGAGYMAVWHDGRRGGIFGSRLDRSGAVLDPDGIEVTAIDSEQHFPDIAFDGKNYLALWSDQRDFQSDFEQSADVYGARISASGTVLDPEGIPIAAGMGFQGYPAVTGGGWGCLAVWMHARDSEGAIYGARISPSGTVLGEGETLISAGGDPYYPDVAFNGNQYLVVWEDHRGGFSDIYGARIDAGGSVLDPEGIAIVTGYPYRYEPKVTAIGSDWYVTWKDNRSGKPQIYGVRMDCSGVVLDLEEVLVSDGLNNGMTPDLASRASGRMLIVFSGFAPSPAYGSERIHGVVWDAAIGPVPLPLVPAPNPFSGNVRISFELPGCTRVRLDVFDAKGRLVKRIVDGYRYAGWNHESWNGKDQENRTVPGGVYFLKLQSRYGGAREKVVLLR